MAAAKETTYMRMPVKLRVSGIVTFGALLTLVTVSTVFADPLKCDLAGYTAASGLTVVVEQDQLAVTWTGTAGTELRARYAIDRAQPVVRGLAVRKAGSQWVVLGENLTPEFTVHTGRRRVAFSQLSSLKDLGIDIARQDVLDREAWFAFWDAPFVVPGVREGQNPMNPDLPRRPEEMSRVEERDDVEDGRRCR